MQNLGVEHVTVHHNLLDGHLIFEWADLQLLEEGRLTGSDLITHSNDFEVGGDFNFSPDNLCLNSQLLEEISLLGVEACWSCLDSDVLWCERTNTCGSFSDLRVKDLLDVTEVIVGENDRGISLEHVHDLFEMWLWRVGLDALLVVLVVFFGGRH